MDPQQSSEISPLPSASGSPSSPIQVVLPGQAVGWAAIEQSVRDFDEQQVQDYKEDIDTLLTFVRLVVTARNAFTAR